MATTTSIERTRPTDHFWFIQICRFDVYTPNTRITSRVIALSGFPLPWGKYREFVRAFLRAQPAMVTMVGSAAVSHAKTAPHFLCPCNQSMSNFVPVYSTESGRLCPGWPPVVACEQEPVPHLRDGALSVFPSRSQGVAAKPLPYCQRFWPEDGELRPRQGRTET